MLWFVGLGISGTRSVPIEVVKIIQKADFVYLKHSQVQFPSNMKMKLKTWLMEVLKLQKDG